MGGGEDPEALEPWRPGRRRGRAMIDTDQAHQAVRSSKGVYAALMAGADPLPDPRAYFPS